MDAERGSAGVGSQGEGLDQPLRKRTSSSDTQFVEGKCKFCNHFVGIHFMTIDDMGYWSFCGISSCDCFVDDKEDDAT